jgi:hypothetical protein
MAARYRISLGASYADVLRRRAPRLAFPELRPLLE